jgi:hypothetical protein
MANVLIILLSSSCISLLFLCYFNEHIVWYCVSTPCSVLWIENLLWWVKSLRLHNRCTVQWRFWRLLISESVSSVEGPKSFEISEISNFSEYTIPKTLPHYIPPLPPFTANVGLNADTQNTKILMWYHSWNSYYRRFFFMCVTKSVCMLVKCSQVLHYVPSKAVFHNLFSFTLGTP